MVLDLIISKSVDGFSAEIPSIKECETWSKTEDDALNKSIELLCYYLGIVDTKKIKIDKARIESNRIIYKLIFHK
ncbi:MAG: hypothetical protein Fur0015_13040 [Ignavibacteriales bacterium]